VLGRDTATEGKERVPAPPGVSSIDVDTLANVLACGGGRLNEFGDLVVEVKRGFLSKKVERYVIEFGIVRTVSGSDAFFAVRERGLKPFLTVLMRREGGKLELRWKCVDESLKHLCKEVLKILKNGLRNYEGGAPTRPRVSGGVASYRISGEYSSKLDGFAEVTLANAMLSYPLVYTTEVSVDEVKESVEAFLQGLERRLGEGRFIVTLSGGGWRFIVGFDTRKKTYTPSFISWDTNERLLGREAVERLRRIPSGVRARLLVFRIPSPLS